MPFNMYGILHSDFALSNSFVVHIEDVCVNITMRLNSIQQLRPRLIQPSLDFVQINESVLVSLHHVLTSLYVFYVHGIF